MGKKVFVVGVGMIKFERPGKRDWDYPEMAKVATLKALKDAGISFKSVEQACVGYVYGDSTCGQRAVYEIGMTGIPIYNVNNNCSTGSTALFMAKQFIEGGVSNCVLALGFEKMQKGSLKSTYDDRTNPMDKHFSTILELRGMEPAPPAPMMFGNAGREHMEKYGTTKDQFAKIAVKNHKHSVNNPYSQFRDEYSLEQIKNSPKVFDPLTKLQCCPTSDGAAAVILCSEEFVIKNNLQGSAVEIVAMEMATDLPSSFEDKSCIKAVGFDMSKLAADNVWKKSGFSAKDVQVVELHDCFSCNELLTYEALGLCPVGEGGKLIDTGNVTYGGKWVVNPSGGLISKGHPLGATGLAQISELCWQLRKMAGNRQVPNCNMALQHNIGLGGAVVVSLLRLGFPSQVRSVPRDDKLNPAVYDEHAEENQKPAIAAASSPIATPASTLKSTAIFTEIEKRVASDPSLSKIGAVFQFDVKDSTGKVTSFTVDLKTAGGKVAQGAPPKADCTVTISDDDLVALSEGKLNPQKAFMQGKYKISGNMSFAMKLGPILQAKAKL